MPEWVPPTVLGAFVLAFVSALYWYAYWRGEVDTDRKNLRDGAIADRKTMNEFMQEIRSDIKEIFRRLPDPQTAAAGSPLTLTDLGHEISEEMGAEKWAGMKAQQLLARNRDILKMQDFEIDEYCGEYVDDRLEPDWRIKVAQTAYNRGLKRDAISVILKIELRDAIILCKAGSQIIESSSE